MTSLASPEKRFRTAGELLKAQAISTTNATPAAPSTASSSIENSFPFFIKTQFPYFYKRTAQKHRRHAIKYAIFVEYANRNMKKIHFFRKSEVRAEKRERPFFRLSPVLPIRKNC